MSGAAHETVLADVDGDVLTITLNRPSALNAVDPAMAGRMAEIGRELASLGAGTRVIVIRGSGRAFMAGGDIRAFIAEPAQIDLTVGHIIDGFHAFLLALARAPQLVLCSVHGAAAGAGFSLCMAADLVIATDDSDFRLAYRQLGTSSDGALTRSLARLVGTRRALEMLLLSDRLDAATLHSLGLINQVVKRDELETETARMAKRLAANSALASAAMKRLTYASLGNSLEQQLRAERDAFVAGSRGPDFREGIAAFLEQRAAHFNQV